MLQDIRPHHLNNSFSTRQAEAKPAAQDYLICMSGERLLVDERKQATLPKCGEFFELFPHLASEALYLFAMDGRRLFLVEHQIEEQGFKYYGGRELLSLLPQWMAFTAATALHLNHWYQTHLYCGRCATKNEHSKTERALICPSCGLIQYPKISPVVIVGIVDKDPEGDPLKDKLLLARNAGGPYQRYGLIAGFVEIGETLEQAAGREVMEEVCIEIKNLHYYKSQPWALSQSILTGFFAEVDGSSEVKVDGVEIAEATWFSRSDIPNDDSSLSLTWEMILAFKNGFTV